MRGREAGSRAVRGRLCAVEGRAGYGGYGKVGGAWVECCGCGGSLLKVVVEYTLKLKGFGIFISVSLFVRMGLMLISTTCNTIHASSSRVTFIMPRL